jgi:hypothetical protein
MDRRARTGSNSPVERLTRVTRRFSFGLTGVGKGGANSGDVAPFLSAQTNPTTIADVPVSLDKDWGNVKLLSGARSGTLIAFAFVLDRSEDPVDSL